MTSSRESSRLDLIDRLQLIGAGSNNTFDRVTDLAQKIFHIPIALVSALDMERQWFLSQRGFDAESMPREHAFCEYTIQHDSVFVVPDAWADRRFALNPVVTGQPYIRFYAGAPLTVAPGIRVGALCVADTKPRDFSPNDMQQLASLAAIVIGEIWLSDLEHDARLDRFLPHAVSPNSVNFIEQPPITGAHVRAARGLLNWSLAQLACHLKSGPP